MPPSLTTLDLRGKLSRDDRSKDIAMLNKMMSQLPKLENLNMSSSAFRFKNWEDESQNTGIKLPTTLKFLCADALPPNAQNDYPHLELVKNWQWEKKCLNLDWRFY